MAAKTTLKARAAWAVCGVILFFSFVSASTVVLLFPQLNKLLAEQTSALILLGGVLFGMLASGWLLTYLLIGRYLRPVEDLRRMAERMARGELSENSIFSLPENIELGEVAVLGDCLRKTCRLLKAYMDDIGHTLERMARGDFTVTVAADYVGDFASIKTSINSIADSLHNVFLSIDDAARRTMGGSYQVSGASGRLSAGVTAQNSSVEALANSMEELRRQISESASYASRANRSAREVDEELRNLRLMETQLLSFLEESRTAAGELLSLTSSLDTLSMQISMLSINASAEAVRSGEKAYGFATVTDEIREYATKSGVASKQASELATRIRDTGERGRQMARAASETMRGLSEKSRATASIIGMIAATSSVQSQAVNRVRKDVSGISAVVHSNAQVAEQCSASSVELTQQAQTLAKILSVFYTKDNASGRVSASSRISARERDYIFHDFE